MSDGEADLGGAISRRDDESCIVEHCRAPLPYRILAIFLPKHAGLPIMRPRLMLSLAQVWSYLLPDAP